MTGAAPQGLPRKGSTEFVTVAGSQLALPPGARRELAYTWTDQPDPINNTTAFTYTVGGDYYEVPLLVLAVFELQTAPSPVVMTVVIYNQQVNVIASIPAPLQQIAGEGNSYSFAVGYGAAYATPRSAAATPSGSTAVAPLPPLLLPPGYQWSLRALTDDLPITAGWTAIAVQSLRIPTDATSPVPPAPTPTIRLV